MADQMAELMRRMPTKEFTAELPTEKVEEFLERGFTGMNRVTTDEEVEWLREVYDCLFSGELDLMPGVLVNDVNRPLGKQRGQTISQLLRPEILYPELKHTVFYRNTQRMARRLFGDERRLDCWGHMVRKAPRDQDIVPWHQDEAYWDPSFDYEGAGFWMPLDPATMESGAMSFIPGSHRGDVLRHGFMDDDPSITTLILLDEIDLSRAVPAPVEIGGVSIHHNRTLHGSGPNATGNPRRAYINEWRRIPVKRDAPLDRPWYWRKLDARVEHNNRAASRAAILAPAPVS